MSGFGNAPIKQEGYTLNLKTGESHPTTDAERETAALSTETWMELPVNPAKQSREEIHKMVDDWLDEWYRTRA